jgi:hypothetical protein
LVINGALRELGERHSLVPALIDALADAVIEAQGIQLDPPRDS